ncbi:MAG: hypothetical protein JNL75_01615 [Chitinophagales bacterium]|nr:hypothetical protein [Chitinophagales bacterium]
MKRNLKYELIPFAIIAIFFIVGYIYYGNKDKKLLKEYIFTMAKITKYEGGGKGIGHFDYFFFINNEKYEGKYIVNSANTNHYTGKSFQVVYSPQDPSNNQLILTNKDYEKFGLSYPDTLPPLNWREMGRE